MPALDVALEVVEVRCRTGALLLDLVRHPGAQRPADAPIVQVFCRKCRDMLLKGEFYYLDRNRLGAYHWVDPYTGEVVESSAVIDPVAGQKTGSHGGRIISAETFDLALTRLGY